MVSTNVLGNSKVIIESEDSVVGINFYAWHLDSSPIEKVFEIPSHVCEQCSQSFITRVFEVRFPEALSLRANIE